MTEYGDDGEPIEEPAAVPACVADDLQARVAKLEAAVRAAIATLAAAL